MKPRELVKWVNMFIYGDAGVGKTHFISTAQDDERTSPLLIIDCEGGMATIRDRDDIDIRRATSREDLNTIHTDLFKQDEPYYKTVAIDTFSEFAKVNMTRIMQDAYNKNPAKVDLDVPSPREWGIHLSHIRKILRAFRDLPCHTIFTAHTNVKTENDVERITPNIQGQGVREVPGFVDIMGYYRSAPGGKRVMQFAKTARVDAKTRYQELGESIEDPTIPLIFELLTKGT